MIGKELEVLLEAESRDGIMKGFSSNYVRFRTAFNPDLINEFARIKVTSVSEDLCSGQIMKPIIAPQPFGLPGHQFHRPKVNLPFYILSDFLDP